MKLKPTLIAAAVVALAVPTGAWAACSADIDMSDRKIINMANPTNAQDAATKNYVDEKGVVGTSKVVFSGGWKSAGIRDDFEAFNAPVITGSDFICTGNSTRCTLKRTGRIIARGMGGLGDTGGNCAVRFYTRKPDGTGAMEYYMGSVTQAYNTVSGVAIADVQADDEFFFGKGNMPGGSTGDECASITRIGNAPVLTVEYIE